MAFSVALAHSYNSSFIEVWPRICFCEVQLGLRIFLLHGTCFLDAQSVDDVRDNNDLRRVEVCLKANEQRTMVIIEIQDSI